MISDKEYKSPLKFPGSGYEMVTCHYPLRLDVYSGCSHDCAYCYAKGILTARGMWNPELIKMADINKIKSAFERAFKGKGSTSISEAIRHKLPVRLGGLTDCFQHDELETGTALKLLKMLNSYDYPYMIVTKSDIVSRAKYLKEISNGKAYVQVTVISLNNKATRKIEPGAPSVSARLKTIEKMANKGIFVCGRLSPVIPKLSTDHIEEYVERMAEAGAKHILAEFFRGGKRVIKKIEDRTGISFIDVMVKNKAYYRTNIEYKNAFYKKLLGLCKEKNVGFSVCSDGDLVPRHFNSTENCCGTDLIPGFENCSTCTANVLAKEVQSKGNVTLDYMQKKYWSPDYKHFEKMWESERITELVEGVEKKSDHYVKKS